MVIKRRFEFSNQKDITAQIADETNTFVWTAFAQNNSGNVILQKQSAFQPDQAFFSLSRSVVEITMLAIDGTNVYVAYNDSSLLGEIISTTNPLTSTTEISIPVGINEAPVDVRVDGSDLWFLIPGSTSGTNTKILKYDTSGTLQITIDLSKSGVDVNNAVSFDIASGGDLWVITSNNPTDLVRVFELSGGGAYDFSVTQISP